MQEVRCKKCHKLLGRTDGELEKDVTLNSASCSPDRIIYMTKCPRCKEETAIVFKKNERQKGERQKWRNRKIVQVAE
jgi:phage FluMu protein Com